MAGNEQVFAATPIRTAGQRVIASPFEFFVTGEDNLRIIGVNSLSSVTLMIQGRMVDEKGLITPLRDTLPLPATRVATAKDINLGVGAVLNLVVFATSASPLIGQTFVIAQLIRGTGAAAIVLGTLFSGYVTSTQPQAWPGSPVESSIAGGGVERTLTGTTPALGAEINETVPTGARWKLVAVCTSFFCDGTVVTRFPNLRLASGAASQSITPYPAGLTAGNAVDITFAQGLNCTAAIPGSVEGFQGIPQGMTLLAGASVKTKTANLQPGDSWAAPQLTVEEWLEAQ